MAVGIGGGNGLRQVPRLLRRGGGGGGRRPALSSAGALEAWLSTPVAPRKFKNRRAMPRSADRFIFKPFAFYAPEARPALASSASLRCG
jgi:hypothetical protein